MPVDYAGSTLGTARELNITPSSQTFTDWVGSLDTNDYYRFSLSGRSSFYLSVDNLSANADVQLLNSSGMVVASSTSSGTNAESISSNLDADTYYIRVFPYGNTNTYYNLSVATPVDYAGNTTSTAREISVGSSTSTYTDFVGSADTNDYYQFTLSNASNLRLAVNKLSADADVQLLRLNSNGTTTQVGGSAASAGTTEAININGLAAGTYLARVSQFSGDTSYNLSLSANLSAPPGSPPAVKPTSSWFSQNLKDATIRSLTQSLAADGELSRDDMIAIFRDTKTDNVVDATELKDLRAIVSKAIDLGMPDYVRVLSNKVVNSDVANQTYKGAALGNLYAGSSATQIENLIGKWFLGNDRPIAQSYDGTTYTYRKASGSLFQNGISYDDVKQGSVGDCYFLVGLSETAFRSPDTLESMFIDNGDSTYTVRFYKNGVADYVTVDKYLPTDAAGHFTYANFGDSYKSASNELWVALAEKAYAQLNESGWIGVGAGRPAVNSYNAIDGGWDYDAIAHITGLNTSYASLNFNAMVNAFEAGSFVGVTSNVSAVASNVVPNHVYAVIGYDSSTQKFTLFNPWGKDGGYLDTNSDGVGDVFKPGTLELSASQLQASYRGWTRTIA
jgi:hypothetical protein